MTVTGQDLIALGMPPGPAFGATLAEANRLGLSGEALAALVAARRPAPHLPLQEPPATGFHLEPESEADQANIAAVCATMAALMRTPTLRAGAVMPDACPAGPEGTIPVGGVAVAESAIHPGMHSADICCSVMLTEFSDAEPGQVLDAIHAVTHFGPGARRDAAFALPGEMEQAFRANPFLKEQRVLQMARSHLGTQGDGNHFAFVGRSAATGRVCLITHHGSRGPGAGLYAEGMRVAERFRRALSPATLAANAWIPADTPEGRAYWEALQLMRQWTKLNHTVLHDAAAAGAGARVHDRLWNEHNFVFRRGDLYFHAKGATPVAADFLPDGAGVQIVPMNMAQPVLLIRAGANGAGLGFAPHGAGRNLSRRGHLRALGDAPEAEVLARETRGLDVRFFCGHPDLSELPSAYKPAATVRGQMARFGLAEVVDEIHPHGSIMAGDWERDAPWRRRLAAREARR